MGNFNMLPSEIMLEILSRVPTESVLECKFVSKPWRNLVRHPSFSQMHLNHLNDSAHDSDGKLSLILYTTRSDEVVQEPFYYTEYVENLRPPFQFYDILNSCNGLICFNASYGIYYPQPAYIFNPITREYIVLPRIVRKPLLSGFGYSPSTNEYKAVRIFKSTVDPNYGIVQVYTLGSGIGWRNGRKMDYDLVSFIPSGVFVNGAIHWRGDKGTIVAFDLADEEFRELPSLPHPIVELQALGGVLCACYHNTGSRKFDIWVLKRNKYNPDHVIWSKKFSNIIGKPIAFTKNRGLLCYAYRGNKVYWYAPKASSSGKVVNFGKNFNFGVPHKNTLVSLKALGEEDTKLMDSNERA